MDGHEILHRHLWCLKDESYRPWSFPPASPWGWHLWFRVKYLDNFLMDCHEICYRYSISLFRMNLNDFGQPPTFSLAPPADQRFHVLSKISQHIYDGLAPDFVRTFMGPTGCFLMTLGIHWQLRLAAGKQVYESAESEPNNEVAGLIAQTMSWKMLNALGVGGEQCLSHNTY